MSREDKFLQPTDAIIQICDGPGKGLTLAGIAGAQQQIADGETPDAVAAYFVHILHGVTTEDIARQLRFPAQAEADLAELDTIIHESMEAFVPSIFNPRWRGREREAVSLYVLGFLQKRCRDHGVLRDQAQIGIEVAVPGVQSGDFANPKGRVCKDIVVWRESADTLWRKSWKDPTHCPLAVIEWKLFRSIHRQQPAVSKRDLGWLASFTKEQLGTVGYAVAIDLEEKHFRVEVVRVGSGQEEKRWQLPDLNGVNPTLAE